jgi:hypothetical protein
MIKALIKVIKDFVTWGVTPTTGVCGIEPGGGLGKERHSTARWASWSAGSGSG